MLEQIENGTQLSWDIYTSEKGAGRVARGLTALFITLVNKALKQHNEKHIDRVHLAREIWKKMNVMMEKYSDYGATDTEPQCDLAHYLRQYLKVDLGRFDY